MIARRKGAICPYAEGGGAAIGRGVINRVHGDQGVEVRGEINPTEKLVGSGGHRERLSDKVRAGSDAGVHDSDQAVLVLVPLRAAVVSLIPILHRGGIDHGITPAEIHTDAEAAPILAGLLERPQVGGAEVIWCPDPRAGIIGEFGNAASLVRAVGNRARSVHVKIGDFGEGAAPIEKEIGESRSLVRIGNVGIIRERDHIAGTRIHEIQHANPDIHHVKSAADDARLGSRLDVVLDFVRLAPHALIEKECPVQFAAGSGEIAGAPETGPIRGGDAGGIVLRARRRPGRNPEPVGQIGISTRGVRKSIQGHDAARDGLIGGRFESRWAKDVASVAFQHQHPAVGGAGKPAAFGTGVVVDPNGALHAGIGGHRYRDERRRLIVCHRIKYLHETGRHPRAGHGVTQVRGARLEDGDFPAWNHGFCGLGRDAEYRGHAYYECFSHLLLDGQWLFLEHDPLRHGIATEEWRLSDNAVTSPTPRRTRHSRDCNLRYTFP